MMNSEEFSSKTPCKIVLILAHRGRAHKPKKRPISIHKATAPDEIWMWDITYLNGPIKENTSIYICFQIYLVARL